MKSFIYRWLHRQVYTSLWYYDFDFLPWTWQWPFQCTHNDDQLSYRLYFDIRSYLIICYCFRHVLKTSLSLIPVLGLQWSLGFSITFGGSTSLQYLYVILASTQVCVYMCIRGMSQTLVK